MRSGDRIAKVDVHLLRPTPRSAWIMAEVTTAEGLSGVGDASLYIAEQEVRQAVTRFGEAIVGLREQAAILALQRAPPTGLVETSARCALDQALHDIAAQRFGHSIARLLRRRPTPELEVYANINRRTLDRTPEGFAASARRAVAAGYDAVKIAPFDGLTAAAPPDEARPRLDAGFARIDAVRAAIGAERRLLVDCHWRLSPATLPPAIDLCAQLGVHWIECPYPEDAERYPDIREAREAVNARGMVLAGGEFKTGRAGFEPLIETDCYDVLMPDMRYVGGYAEFMGVAAAAARRGIAISPHNPAGPVCHAHSVQAAAAIDNLSILEMQFDETDAFEAIVAGEPPMPRVGRLAVPTSPGLGLSLSHAGMATFVEV